MALDRSYADAAGGAKAEDLRPANRQETMAKENPSTTFLRGCGSTHARRNRAADRCATGSSQAPRPGLCFAELVCGLLPSSDTQCGHTPGKLQWFHQFLHPAAARAHQERVRSPEDEARGTG